MDSLSEYSVSHTVYHGELMSSKDNERETIEVTSSWFSIKMAEINGYTLTAIAMILIALVMIVWIVTTQA